MLLDEVNIAAEASVPIEEIDRIFAVDLLSNQLFIDVIPLLGLDQTVVDEKLADLLCSHAVYIVEVLFSYKFLSCEVTLFFLPSVWPITKATRVGTHLSDSCAQLLHSLLFHFFLLLLCYLHLPGFFFVRKILLVVIIRIIERIKQDGEEQIEQDEVTDENPRDVVD